MVITSVQIRILDNTGTRLKAVASVTLDNMIAIHDIKIIEKETGLFIAMPSTTKPGGFQDIVHPINAETRQVFENVIITIYRAALESDKSVLLVAMDSEEHDTVLTQKPDLFNLVENQEKHDQSMALHSRQKNIKSIKATKSKKGADFISWLQI